MKYIKSFKNHKTINESKSSELQGFNILKSKKISNAESIIKELSVGDKSNNQKNIPFMCFFLNNNVEINDLIDVFNEYDDLERKKRVKSIQLIKNQIIIGDEKFNDFLEFSEWVHGESSKYHKKSTDSKSFVDFKTDKKPILSGNGIDIYDTNDVSECIYFTQGGLTGKRYDFCIGQPGNTMYRSYRDRKTSTFYFIVDRNRIKKNEDGSINLDDPLHIVVYDSQGPVRWIQRRQPKRKDKGVELTDANNTTGNIAEYGRDVNAYVDYLKSKGVPVEKLVNRPKTEQEILEDKLLGNINKNLDWFKKLPIELKSSYIGRGYILTDDQFDYLLTSKELISQYVDTGIKLPQYQVSKLSNQDKKTYIRKRMIVNDFCELYEIELMDPDQKKEYIGRGYILTDDQFDYLLTSKELISQYVDTGIKLTQYQVSKLSNQDKKTYIKKRMTVNDFYESYEIELMDPDQKKNYIEERLIQIQKPDLSLLAAHPLWPLQLMNPDQKKVYIGNIEKFDKMKFDDFIYEVFIYSFRIENRYQDWSIKLSNFLLNEENILRKIKRYYDDNFIRFLFQISKRNDNPIKIMNSSRWSKFYSDRFK